MRGRVASKGMAFAEAYPVYEPTIQVIQRKASNSQLELERFQSAKSRCSDKIMKLMDNYAENNDNEFRDILDFQFLILEDTDFIGDIERLILEDGWDCEYAVWAAADKCQKNLQKMTDNDYLQARAIDVGDLAKQLLCELMGVSYGISEPDVPYIAVATDLSPSQLTGMCAKKLVGIILEKGAMTAHTVIIARSRGIPCLIDTPGAMGSIEAGKPILLDGFDGSVYLRPDEHQIIKYGKYVEKIHEEQIILNEYRNKETRTKDGFTMEVYANITSHLDVGPLIEQGGEGVGLFRTELLFMETEGSPPSEELQFETYRKAAEELRGRALIIRTLDVGGDKEISYLGITKEENPFLGYRAIRYCLDHKDLFNTQLSAILRASAYGNIQLMFPMITTVEEITQARAAVRQVMAELSEKNIAYDEKIKIGMMVETPAAAVDANRFADKIDFFSVGTNDLAQYLFAADRTNAKVSNLNSFFQPTLLRMVNHIVECARGAGIEVDICGQAGEVPELIPLWIGMGIRKLSVSIPEITRIRHIICESDMSSCRKLLSEVLELDTEGEVQDQLAKA